MRSPRHLDPRLLTAALAAALLAACGGTLDPVDGAGGSGGAGGLGLPACVPDGQEEPPHPDITGASYEVPVPVALEPYASYPIGDVSLCESAGLLQLGYSLPELLLGKKERVSFVGGYDEAQGVYALSSADGTASCVIVGTSWTCTEHFVGIEVDLAELAKETEDLPPDQQQGYYDVAQIFIGDPIGILHFTLP